MVVDNNAAPNPSNDGDSNAGGSATSNLKALSFQELATLLVQLKLVSQQDANSHLLSAEYSGSHLEVAEMQDLIRMGLGEDAARKVLAWVDQIKAGTATLEPPPRSPPRSRGC